MHSFEASVLGASLLAEHEGAENVPRHQTSAQPREGCRCFGGESPLSLWRPAFYMTSPMETFCKAGFFDSESHENWQRLLNTVMLNCVNLYNPCLSDGSEGHLSVSWWS